MRRKMSKARCWARRFACVGLRRFGLQRAMETLLPSILLRLAGLDALDADSEPQPPHRELREAAGAHRGEGRTVVRANGRRQPELAEGRVEDALNLASVRLLDTLAANQVARVRVEDRQRV